MSTRRVSVQLARSGGVNHLSDNAYTDAEGDNIMVDIENRSAKKNNKSYKSFYKTFAKGEWKNFLKSYAPFYNTFRIVPITTKNIYPIKIDFLKILKKNFPELLFEHELYEKFLELEDEAKQKILKPWNSQNNWMNTDNFLKLIQIYPFIMFNAPIRKPDRYLQDASYQEFESYNHNPFINSVQDYEKIRFIPKPNSNPEKEVKYVYDFFIDNPLYCEKGRTKEIFFKGFEKVIKKAKIYTAFFFAHFSNTNLKMQYNEIIKKDQTKMKPSQEFLKKFESDFQIFKSKLNKLKEKFERTEKSYISLELYLSQLGFEATKLGFKKEDLDDASITLGPLKDEFYIFEDLTDTYLLEKEEMLKNFWNYWVLHNFFSGGYIKEHTYLEKHERENLFYMYFKYTNSLPIKSNEQIDQHKKFILEDFNYDKKKVSKKLNDMIYFEINIDKHNETDLYHLWVDCLLYFKTVFSRKVYSEKDAKKNHQNLPSLVYDPKYDKIPEWFDTSNTYKRKSENQNTSRRNLKRKIHSVNSDIKEKFFSFGDTDAIMRLKQFDVNIENCKIDDAIINYWMNILQNCYYEKNKENSKFVIPLTLIMNKLKSATKDLEKNILDKDEIVGQFHKYKYTKSNGDVVSFKESDDLLIPINSENEHWYLVHIHSAANEKIIKIYDSAEKEDINSYREELNVLFFIIKGVDEEENIFFKKWIWDYKIKIMNVPQQPDGASCGIFLLYFAECVIFNKKIDQNFGSMSIEITKNGVRKTIQSVDVQKYKTRILNYLSNS